MKNLKKQFLTTFIAGGCLLGGIALLLNMVFSNFNFGRFDLTADQVYRLSPAVSSILEKLEAPIEITYYVSSSEKMPTQWKNLERDVIDKLEDIKRASKGKLTYEVFDPSVEEEKEALEEKKAEDENTPEKEHAAARKKIAERLYEKGVIPFGVQSAERDEFAVKRVYSSIVLSYLDRKEDVIEEVRPETFGNLEYEIMSRVYKLIANRRPRIGFYPGQPEIPPQYRQYYQQAPPDLYDNTVELLKQQGYDITRTNITEDDPIPQDITTMVVMVDQPLEERQLYELDKLLYKGVHMVLAGQTYNYQVMPAPNKPGEFMLRAMPTQMNLSELLKPEGIEFEKDMFMDKNTAYIQVPVYQNRNLGFMQVREQRMQPVTKPVMIRVAPENINRKTSITNKLTDVFYMYGTRLILNEPLLKELGIKTETLFTSSDVSWTQPGYGYGPVNEEQPESNLILSRQPLALYLEGKFTPKFAEGNIPAWQSEPGQESPKTEDQPTELTGDPAENKVILFGASNIFKSDMIQSIPGHQALLTNCVDALTLGDDLIKIRSKNIAARQIRETGPAGKAAAKFFVVWVPALLFVAAGIYLNVQRRKKQPMLQK